VNVLVGIVAHHVDEASDLLLAFLKFVWVFLATVLVIGKKRFDEVDQLVDRCLGLQLLVVLDHGLADAESNCSLVREAHVVHQGWVVVHAEHCD
jgi:hypothetical protein